MPSVAPALRASRAFKAHEPFEHQWTDLEPASSTVPLAIWARHHQHHRERPAVSRRHGSHEVTVPAAAKATAALQRAMVVGPVEHRIDACQLRCEASFIRDVGDHGIRHDGQPSSPNSAVVTVLINGQVHALVWALRSIAKHSEITFDKSTSTDHTAAALSINTGVGNTDDEEGAMPTQLLYEVVDRDAARSLSDGKDAGLGFGDWNWAPADAESALPASSLPLAVTCATSLAVLPAATAEFCDSVALPACLFRGATAKLRQPLLAAVKTWLTGGRGAEAVVMGRIPRDCQHETVSDPHASSVPNQKCTSIRVFARHFAPQFTILCEFQGIRLTSPVGCFPWWRQVAPERLNYVVALESTRCQSGSRQTLRDLLSEVKISPPVSSSSSDEAEEQSFSTDGDQESDDDSNDGDQAKHERWATAALAVLPSVAAAQRSRAVLLPRLLTKREIHTLLTTVACIQPTAGRFSRDAGGEMHPPGKAPWNTTYLHTHGAFKRLCGPLYQKLLSAAIEVDKEHGWNLLTDRIRSCGPINFRTVEYHEVGRGGALPSRTHYDAGSLVTIDVVLEEEFEGGEFVTVEDDGSDNVHAGFHSAGTAMIFQSHKPHHVRPVRAGKRSVLVCELWHGPERCCAHRCNQRVGTCTPTGHRLLSPETRRATTQAVRRRQLWMAQVLGFVHASDKVQTEVKAFLAVKGRCKSGANTNNRRAATRRIDTERQAFAWCVAHDPLCPVPEASIRNLSVDVVVGLLHLFAEQSIWLSTAGDTGISAVRCVIVPRHYQLPREHAIPGINEIVVMFCNFSAGEQMASSRTFYARPTAFA
jgi:hypothetical protein